MQRYLSNIEDETILNLIKTSQKMIGGFLNSIITLVITKQLFKVKNIQHMERCLNLHIMRVFLIKFLVAPSNILTILTSIHKLTEIGFGAILVQSEIFCLQSLCGLLQVFPTLHNFREKM